jgi:DNA-binding response OmpR family regulator
MGKFILVVEDEAIIALDLETSLSDAGYTVLVASSCAAALGILSTWRPDAAILDVQLRDGDCEDVATSLATAGVPFIVHTGTPASDLSPVFRMGKYICKPSDLGTELVELLKSTLTPTA